jgi:hypothetical protein
MILGHAGRQGRPTQTNLASLSHLRELTLPADALLPEAPRVLPVPEFDEFDPEYYDEGLRNEAILRHLHEAEHRVEIPTASLCQLLTHSLQHLIIIDDRFSQADKVRLDEEIRNLMLDSQFSELRAIRLKRQVPWPKRVNDVGWHEERHARFWKALLRPGSVSGSDT